MEYDLILTLDQDLLAEYFEWGLVGCSRVLQKSNVNMDRCSKTKSCLVIRANKTLRIKLSNTLCALVNVGQRFREIVEM